jgi:tRNA (guanine-N7-)-methyltransferase
MRLDPYSHCPRLPAEGPIDPRHVFHGAPAPIGDSSPDVVGIPPKDLPVELEIGPGRGWFTVERLEVDPSVRIVGLEIKRKWATIVDERLAKRKLGHRGRIFAEDAKLVLPRFVSGSVSVAYLHFPDPWWKKRHLKRLVLQDSLLVELSRILIVGGELFIQTDVFERADEYEAEVAACSAFEPYGASARVSENPYQARSPRERKAIENGLPVARLHYRCRGPVS